MKTYKDTEKEITEGNRYFAVYYEVLPIGDKYYAQIIMSCFDDQSEEEDCLMFEYLENAIMHCCKDNFYTGVSYSDYRMNKTLFINK